MSSSGSHEEAAAALDALAWIDEEEAFALVAQMFGGGGGAECALDSPSSPEGSEGGSSGRGSACTMAPAGVVGSGVGMGARMAPATKLSTRLDGLRWLDPECSRGCDLYAPNARGSRTLRRCSARWTHTLFSQKVAAPLTRVRAAPRRCIAAPPASSEGSYQLVGDLGKARRHAGYWQPVGSRNACRATRTPPTRHADAPAAPSHARAQKNGEKKLRRCAAGRGGRARAATRRCTAA